MTELSREQIECDREWLKENAPPTLWQAVDRQCDMALRAHDTEAERDRYRALLAGYAGALEELARVHDALGCPSEAADYRGKAHEIETALEGKNNG